MHEETKNRTTDDSAEVDGKESREADRDQGIQINDNTIADPDPPTVDNPSTGQSHGGRGEPEADQGLQINDNTIADTDTDTDTDEN